MYPFDHEYFELLPKRRSNSTFCPEHEPNLLKIRSYIQDTNKFTPNFELLPKTRPEHSESAVQFGFWFLLRIGLYLALAYYGYELFQENMKYSVFSFRNP